MYTVSYVLVWLAQPGLGVGLVCRYCLLDMDIFFIHFVCLGSLCVYYAKLLKCTGLAQPGLRVNPVHLGRNVCALHVQPNLCFINFSYYTMFRGYTAIMWCTGLACSAWSGSQARTPANTLYC